MSPRRGKIDDQVLFRLLVQERQSQREAALHFGVSDAAISKRVKALNVDLPRHVGLARAQAVADHGLDVMSQLQEVNTAIRRELAWALAEARKTGGDRKALQATVIELASEVRKQLAFQLEILRALYDVRGIKEFQEEVLRGIEDAAPEVRRAIVERLVERRALRSALDLAPTGA